MRAAAAPGSGCETDGLVIWVQVEYPDVMGGEAVVDDGSDAGDDESMLRSLVEHAAAGLLVVDDAGTVRFANPAIERLLGYGPSELVGGQVGRLFDDRFPGEQGLVGSLERPDEPGTKPLDGWSDEVPAVHGDGHEVLVSVDVTEHDHRGDRIQTWVVTDAAPGTRREEALRERTAELEEFAAVLSHDLRNPLTVAEGYLDLALAEHDTDDLRQVEAALDRMRQLVDDTSTRARYGRVDGATQVLPFGDVMRAAWDAVPTGDASLVLPERSWRIRADDSRLRQLVENLVRNAVEHAGHPPTVHIGVLPAGGGFYLEDDGPGLPDAAAARFEAPHRMQHAPGSGYGLRIVAQIADEHGWGRRAGDVDGGGARFEFHGARVYEQ